MINPVGAVKRHINAAHPDVFLEGGVVWGSPNLGPLRRPGLRGFDPVIIDAAAREVRMRDGSGGFPQEIGQSGSGPSIELRTRGGAIEVDIDDAAVNPGIPVISGDDPFIGLLASPD